MTRARLATGGAQDCARTGVAARYRLRLRSTFGTCSASGSASKNSRLVKPNMPASSTLGNVWIELL